MYTAPVMAILTANTSAAYVYRAKLKGAGYIVMQCCITVFKDEFSTHHTVQVLYLARMYNHCSL